MKSNTPDNKKPWLVRLKTAIAAFAFVGATIAGGVAVSDVHDSVDQEEARTSLKSEYVRYDGPASYGRSVSWW